MASRELPNLTAEIEDHRANYAELGDAALHDRLVMYNSFYENGDRNGPLLPHHRDMIYNIITHLSFEVMYRKGAWNREIEVLEL